MADAPPPYSPYPTKEGLADPSPPAQAYTYQQPATQTIVMTTTSPAAQPLIKINPASFPVEPVQLQCPHCNATVRTDTQMVTGAVTWLVCFVLIVMIQQGNSFRMRRHLSTPFTMGLYNRRPDRERLLATSRSDDAPPAYSEVVPSAPPLQYHSPTQGGVPPYTGLPQRAGYNAGTAPYPAGNPKVIVLRDDDRGERPMATCCPICRRNVITRVSHQEGGVNEGLICMTSVLGCLTEAYSPGTCIKGFVQSKFRESMPRMNDAPVKGYESDVGSRTDFRFFYPESSTLNQADLDSGTYYVVVMYKSNDLNWLQAILTKVKPTGQFWKGVAQKLDIDPAQFLILNPQVLHVAARDVRLQGKWPTTGLIATTFALHYCDVVDLAGFGYGSSIFSHYYERDKTGGLPAGGTQHNVTVEKEYLIRLLDEGVISHDLTGVYKNSSKTRSSRMKKST
uniref:LITAF domain-containing protein n=1 Tax=Branchiostoma floridae TaxID=7739 RepID=C3ZI66_BRAFL|eukprot:XP_002591797.1 hypothetical protein BRAFLDRAFT_123538 [Branchiostoma floridae]